MDKQDSQVCFLSILSLHCLYYVVPPKHVNHIIITGKAYFLAQIGENQTFVAFSHQNKVSATGFWSMFLSCCRKTVILKYVTVITKPCCPKLRHRHKFVKSKLEVVSLLLKPCKSIFYDFKYLVWLV